VVTDPEGKYKTQARRNKAEAGMIDQVLASLPLQLRTDAMKRDLGHLIHLRNWNEEFEYAHFSNTELAKAIRAVVGPTCSSFVELRKDVQAARGSRRPLKSVWKDWTPKPSKVLLAEALWPHLRNRIVNPRSRRAIPVVDIVEEAITISHKVHRAREMAVDQNN